MYDLDLAMRTEPAALYGRLLGHLTMLKVHNIVRLEILVLHSHSRALRGVEIERDV